MTKGTLLFIIACTLLGVSSQLDGTESIQLNDHYNLHDSCMNLLNDQVGWELYASIVYLNMGGYFGRPTVAKPGYAKFFLHQSQEEYQHASKFIEYINRRNGTVKRISLDDSPKSDWTSPREALADAIKLEKHIYSKIHHIHDVADQKCLDRHLTGFIESDFFIEQVDSIKQLQLLLNTIDKPDDPNMSTLEYMEDKRLSKMKNEEL